MVVEEKRSLIEVQLREELYGTAHQPHGDRQEGRAGRVAVSRSMARSIPTTSPSRSATRLLQYRTIPLCALGSRRSRLRSGRLAEAIEGHRQAHRPISARAARTTARPRCPRARGAYAGIGCHYMAQLDGPRDHGFTQMGGEGANWVGEARSRAATSSRTWATAPITIRAIAGDPLQRSRPGVNITYKILFNDAVAMTGGQPVDGQISRAADRPPGRVPKASSASRWSRTSRTSIPPAALASRHHLHHRDDSTRSSASCARPGRLAADLRPDLRHREAPPAQARRLSRSGQARASSTSWSAKAAAIAACKSNCVSVQPLETEFGRKRQIDQSNCNKDFSCVKGFCPSFVTVHGARIEEGGRACSDGRLPRSAP
jgi:indolepyruvate ferredoxin oxidoreductase